MSGPRTRWTLMAAGLLLATTAQIAQAQMAVRILSPEAGQPVFGNTDVRIGVSGSLPVDRVEVFVNGKLAGTTKTAPYHVQVDVGEDNVEREFKAVAYAPTGITGAATVVTAPVTINEEMNLKLRVLFASVGSGGSRRLDLTKDDFQVIDNNQLQQVVTFGRDEMPLTAVLLLDTSESMGGERQEAVRRGAKAFLDGMKPSDEAMLALFSDRLLRYTPFSADKSSLEPAIVQTQAAGGTAVNDFLYMSLKLLDDRQGQRVVVLFSDGSDVHSVLPAADVLWKARAGQALIYWIQLGGKHQSFTSSWRGFKENDKEYDDLEKAVSASGGRVVTIDRLDQLEGAFRSILQELREQYALGYYPTIAKGDGKWHKVEVRVKDSLARVKTREGYTDH